jgi:hypothetical protein
MVEDAPEEELPPRVVETRTALRQRALLSGKLANHDGSITVDCTIKDLSETGARIVIPRGRYIPSHVFLVHSRSTLVIEAEISWTKPPQYGLKFVRSFARDASLPPELNFLNRLRV